MCCRLHAELLLGNSPNLELDTLPKPPVTAVPAQDQGPLGPSPGTLPGSNTALADPRVPCGARPCAGLCSCSPPAPCPPCITVPPPDW